MPQPTRLSLVDDYTTVINEIESTVGVHSFVHSLETDGSNLTLDFGSSSLAGRIRFELPPGRSDL